MTRDNLIGMLALLVAYPLSRIASYLHMRAIERKRP